MTVAEFSSDVLQPTAKPTLSKAINTLPPKLREMIYKEYLAIEKREALSRREFMGWGEVHNELLDAPFCDLHLYDHES